MATGSGAGQAGVGARSQRHKEVACVQVLTLMFLLLGLKQESRPASSFLLFPVLCVGTFTGIKRPCEQLSNPKVLGEELRTKTATC